MDLRNYILLIQPTLDIEDKFIFFGIAKNAQTSINRFLLKYRSIVFKDNSKIYTKRLNMYSNTDLQNIFKYTIVRNPWERVVSAYHYLKERRFLNDNDFRIFIEKIGNGELDSYHIRVKQHLVPQIPMFSINGESVVNFIGRLENIKEDWKYIANQINCTEVLPHKNKSNHKHYRRYYTKKSKKIVERIYAEDIETLNYNF